MPNTFQTIEDGKRLTEEIHAHAELAAAQRAKKEDARRLADASSKAKSVSAHV